jgi:hypothetical protein
MVHHGLIKGKCHGAYVGALHALLRRPLPARRTTMGQVAMGQGGRADTAPPQGWGGGAAFLCGLLGLQALLHEVHLLPLLVAAPAVKDGGVHQRGVD